MSSYTQLFASSLLLSKKTCMINSQQRKIDFEKKVSKLLKRSMKLNDSDVMNGVKEMRQRNLQITFTKPLFVLRYKNENEA